MPKQHNRFYVRYTTCERCPVLGWKPDTHHTYLEGPFHETTANRRISIALNRLDVLPGSVEIIEK